MIDDVTASSDCNQKQNDNSRDKLQLESLEGNLIGMIRLDSIATI